MNARPAETSQDLISRRCRPYDKGEPPLNTTEIDRLAALIPDWSRTEQPSIRRTFSFSDFHETMAFLNAAAWVAHQQDHHPDIRAGYKSCRIDYATHSVGGLTENDFICAARIDAIYAG